MAIISKLKSLTKIIHFQTRKITVLYEISIIFLKGYFFSPLFCDKLILQCFGCFCFGERDPTQDLCILSKHFPTLSYSPSSILAHSPIRISCYVQCYLHFYSESSLKLTPTSASLSLKTTFSGHAILKIRNEICI